MLSADVTKYNGESKTAALKILLSKLQVRPKIGDFTTYHVYFSIRCFREYFWRSQAGVF